MCSADRPLTCLLSLLPYPPACRYTADIPQHGSASGADGKPVIFPYIDLNIQTLQANGAIRSAMQQQQQSAAAGPPTSNGSSNPVTPGRGLLAAAGSVAASNGMRPAAAAPQTPGSAVRAHRDGIMAQLSEVFTRLSTHMQASSKDSKEKVCCGMDTRPLMQVCWHARVIFCWQLSTVTQMMDICAAVSFCHLCMQHAVLL
jgi:hypothetical protein